MTTDDLDFEIPEDEDEEVAPAPPAPPAVGPDDDDTIEVFDTTTPAVVPVARDDLQNAQFLYHTFGQNVLYDHRAKAWFIWHKGTHYWQEDGHEEVHIMTRNAAMMRARKAAAQNNDILLRIAMALYSRPARVRALEDLRSEPGVGMDSNMWNPDPTLFCVQNGVIDLTDGSLRAGQQDDLINKASPVRYEPMAGCPLWETFLLEVFETQEMVDYVQTIVGYCMTGLTVEQVWFLLYGTGGNGKSVFLSILKDIFGLEQYFESAAAETFIATRWVSGGNNIAQLKDARLVVANEVPENATFDSGRLKALTGGDLVTARELYKNNETWVPRLKLMMLVNHLPTTRDDTDGFWRRIRTIPFNVSFLGRENPHLAEELRAELPGILNWCVSGAVTYFRYGLGDEPAVASQLRAEYKAEMDPLAMFINDCIVETNLPSDLVPARDLYRTYLTWSASEGHVAMPVQTFGRAPVWATTGLGKKVMKTGTFYVGIKVYEPGVHVVTGVHSEG